MRTAWHGNDGVTDLSRVCVCMAETNQSPTITDSIFTHACTRTRMDGVTDLSQSRVRVCVRVRGRDQETPRIRTALTICNSMFTRAYGRTRTMRLCPCAYAQGIHGRDHTLIQFSRVRA